jgi:hypothetical protein
MIHKPRPTGLRVLLAKAAAFSANAAPVHTIATGIDSWPSSSRGKLAALAIALRGYSAE